ncbi:hypothetical protein Axi01nite_72690 [Actinoplanes xinjiangensis]|nr:hypothetical protein Axi01nite_72690 [Actinoplanes xinjiangensis]
MRQTADDHVGIAEPSFVEDLAELHSVAHSDVQLRIPALQPDGESLVQLHRHVATTAAKPFLNL